MDSRQLRKEGVGHIDSLFSLSAKLIVACLFISLLIGQSGCATSKPYSLPSPPSEVVRAKLGTIGVASARFLPKLEMDKPMGKISGSGQGALDGAGLMIFGGLVSGDPLGFLLGVVLAPVGAVVGSVVGAVKGESSEHLKEAEDAINKAISELKIQATMRDYVLRAAKQQTEYNFVDIEEQKKMGSSLLLTHDRKKNIQHRNLHNTKRLQGLKDMTEKLINRYGRYRGC